MMGAELSQLMLPAIGFQSNCVMWRALPHNIESTRYRKQLGPFLSTPDPRQNSGQYYVLVLLSVQNT